MDTPREELLESQDHRDLRDALWEEMSDYGGFIIAVDGRNGAGKSTLARYLGWQLGMPPVNLDTFRCGSRKSSDAQEEDINWATFDVFEEELLLVLNSWLKRDKPCPVIVEGVFVLRTLDRLSMPPRILVNVESEDYTGGPVWQKYFEDYESKYPRSRAPDLRFCWKGSAGSLTRAEVLLLQ